MELYKRLKEYAASDYYPWHMPGHKRQMVEFDNPFSMDITEISGFDDLHHAEGILKEAMERAAAVYGAGRSFFLVNGSSCGIMAAVSACVKPQGKLLLARNCHKSAYYGALLSQADISWIYPQLEGAGFYGVMEPETVRKALEADPEIEAVMLVSPGYEGIVSDIETIAEIVHEHNCVLIVDEAHGAHFPFGSYIEKRENQVEFPKSALACGADLVIQSLHKTLPSLTQTAILHKSKNAAERVREDLLELYLKIYQSSSPSYIFMASIENCIQMMSSETGKKMMETYSKNLYWIRSELKSKLQFLRLYHPKEIAGYNQDLSVSASVQSIYSEEEMTAQNQKLSVPCSASFTQPKEMVLYDPSKLVICGAGNRLAVLLRESYHLEPEMNTDQYVILMTSPADQKEAFERLLNALLEIDILLMEENRESDSLEELFEELPVQAPKARMKPAFAAAAKGHLVPLEDSLGKINREFIYLYPPGIPILIPGEEIGEKQMQVIASYQKHGLTVHGVENGMIDCI